MKINVVFSEHIFDALEKIEILEMETVTTYPTVAAAVKAQNCLIKTEIDL